jgi:hypothetical protein
VNNSYYTYNKIYKLLIECFCGESDFEDVFELRKEIELHVSETEKINILIDIRDNISPFSYTTIEEFIPKYIESGFTSKIKRIAIVTDTPTQVAKTMLFIDGIKELNLPIKTFSSIEFAINWLHTGISIETVESILSDIKKNKN